VYVIDSFQVSHRYFRTCSATCMCNARKLDIFAEFRVEPSQIRAGHSDKVTKAADNATIAVVEVRFGVGVKVIF